MPSATKPPCIGSWPDPPPDTRATLPCTGASARTIVYGSYVTRIRSACAASMPWRASRTTSAGSLISFFIASPPRSSWLEVTERGGTHVAADHSADQWTDDRDPRVSPVRATLAGDRQAAGG